VNLGSTTIIWLKCALAQDVSPDFDTAEQLPRGLDRVFRAASWLVLKRMELRIQQKVLFGGPAYCQLTGQMACISPTPYGSGLRVETRSSRGQT